MNIYQFAEVWTVDLEYFSIAFQCMGFFVLHQLNS